MKTRRIMALLLATVMTVMPGLPAAAADSSGLQNQVLNLDFEGNLNDASGKGNNGTCSSGTPQYTEGMKGKALQLNGSSFVNLGTSNDLSPSKLTLSFWIKPDAEMSGEQMITWNKKQWYTDGWYVASNASAMEFSLGPANENKQPYMVRLNMARTSMFPTGEWTHMVLTYDSDTKEAKFYRNGIECKNTSIGYGIDASVGATGVIGAPENMQKAIGYNGPNYNGSFLKASLDSYQLYNDVATEEEVIALYEAGGASFDKKAIAQKDADALSVPATTKGSVSLPTTGVNGSTITWTSSNEAVIARDGSVTRPEIGQDNVDVTLTASVSYAGSEAVTKTFTVTVIAKTDAAAVTSSIMGDVTLEDAYLANAFDKEVDYLLSMNSKKFLYEFYKVAGLTPPTTSGYGGWERTGAANFRGHTFGHYMSALSMCYLSSDNEADKQALLTQIEDAVSGLEECQNAYAVKYPDHAGYISAFPEGCLSAVDGVAAPTGNDGSLIVPYYNLHKVLAGLLEISKSVDDADLQQRALTVAEKFGDFLYNRFQKLTDKNRMLRTEYGGMNEALYELYNLTGNEHAKIAAQYFDETNLFEQLANNQDVLSGKHANTTIPKFTGAVKRYTVLSENEEYYNTLTAEEKSNLNMYLTAAKNFWDIVIKDHTYVTGGNSQSEHFHDAGKIGADATSGAYGAALTCETCNTYNMLKLSKALYHVTGDKKYMDYFENTYINAIVSSQNPETGTTMYFQPMAPGYNKVFNRPHDEFWCCTGTGMENFSKLGDNIYEINANEVFVHMFFSSEVTDKTNNIRLTQTAKMPNEDTVTFAVAAADGGSVKAGTVLKLRKPDWLAGAAEIKVNDKAIELKEENGYYAVPVKTGDKISYKMPMTVVAYDMPDNPNMVAFKYGPVVLSTALGTDNIERSAGNGILVRVGTLDEKAKTNILMENYDDIEEWKADAAKNLVRIEDSEDGKVQFQLQNTDSPELIYTPHYMRYKESYGLYMFIEGADSQAAQNRILTEKQQLRDIEISNDSLYMFDDNNSEKAKNVQSSNSTVGSFNGRTYRDARGGGWFSYDLKVDPQAEHNYLFCTFYSGDRSRKFDIIANNNTLETYAFADAPSGNGQFFEHMIEIPKEVAQAAKDGKVTIKFASVNNGLVGGVFGLRTSSTTDYDKEPAMKNLSFNEGTLSPAYDSATTKYVLTIPKDTDSLEMTAVPNVPSGLIYVNGILIDDTQPRVVDTAKDETYLRIVSKAQDHTTAKTYDITILKEGAQQRPAVIADFHFDDEETGFTNGYAVAAGNHSLQDHDGGKALYLDGTDDFLSVTKKNGESLLTGIDEMTISFQTKPESGTTNWGFYAAPDDSAPSYQNEKYVGILNNGNIVAERYLNDGARPASASTSAGTSDWHYVTVVHTENEVILYINGVEKAREASVYGLRDILKENSILYIGKATWEKGEYYKGLIDNYKIMSYAMTADEVKAMVSGVSLESVELTAPSKTEYKTGEDLDLTGMKLVAKYSDGTEKEIPSADVTITGYDKNAEGEQTVTVSYGGKSATFKVTVEKKEDPEPVMPYVDVDKETGSWYYDAVYYNYVKKTMTGTDPTHFAPGATLVRAQVAVIIHRLAGEPEITGEYPFADGNEPWFEKAVTWAASEDVKVITGYTGTDCFGPADEITRSQLAVMLYRYAKYKEYDVTGTADYSTFTDVDDLQAFAVEGMNWAVANGIITGKDLDKDGVAESLQPQGSASRAECAIMIQRFMEKYES